MIRTEDSGSKLPGAHGRTGRRTAKERSLLHYFPDRRGALRCKRQVRLREERLARLEELVRGQSEELIGVNEKLRAEIALRREREGELRESQRFIQGIADTTPNILYIYDILEERVIYINSQIRTILGYSPEQIHEPGFMLKVIHHDDWKIPIENYKRIATARDGEIIEYEYRARHASGAWRWLYSRVVVFSRTPDGKPRRTLGTIEDITRRKETEEEVERHRHHLEELVAERTAALARTNEQLQREIEERRRIEERLEHTIKELEQSNAGLEQFAYTASHDLKEPLRVIEGFLKILERRYRNKLDQEAREFISFALEGAGRMDMLISDLLEYSRVGSQRKPFKPTDTEAVLNRARANLKVAVEESGAVITHTGLPEVMADELQLVQLFQNLLSNAIKFRSREPLRVHVAAEKHEEEWVFSVRDNGIGIPPEQTERIFKIFQRLHSRGEYAGTGIGLAICKRIVENHGGRIWVKSEEGKGATFFFTIPVRSERR